LNIFESSKKTATMSPLEAYKAMQASNRYVLLDVRSFSEYREIRIGGANLIPLGELSSRAPSELLDKNVPIYVYCRSGARAGRAARLLTEMGYKRVFDIGGIVNWPYETVKG